MSLLTLRDIDSKLKRILKGSASDSETSDTDTVIIHPLHNVLFLSFAFTEENASYAVSFTIHPDGRYIFVYAMESNNGIVNVTKQYTWEQIEADENVKLVFQASQKLSLKVDERANESMNGGGYPVAKTYLIQRSSGKPYERRFYQRYVTDSEIAGTVAYTNQCFRRDDTTEYTQMDIERMIDWGRLAIVSRFVHAHPPIVIPATGMFGREEITWEY